MITPTPNIVLMGEQINTFLDYAELTELNYLTHILDFDYEHDNNDLLESIKISEYYTELDFIKMCTHEYNHEYKLPKFECQIRLY